MGIMNECERLDELQKLLEINNLKVWREEIPDQCINWTHPYRVDLIFEIPNYGLIGVEGKILNTHGQGSKYAEAYLQIRDKYKNKTYFGGKKIDCASKYLDNDEKSKFKFLKNKLGFKEVEDE